MKMIEKRQPYRNKKILQAAKGEPCLANFPGCTGGGEDTVFCHFNSIWAGKGTGQKADDCAGFFGCQKCHDLYDGRRRPSDDFDISNYVSNSEWDDYFWEYVLKAYYRTIRRLIDMEVLK